MSLIPMTYVCVVSEHNLPNLEAILCYRPQTVILIATANFTQAAKRLKDQLLATPEFARTAVLLADTEHLAGNTLANSQHWVQHALVPLLQRHATPHFLNLTGGTKPLAVALLYGHAWQECHYKALGIQDIERFVITERGPQVLTTASPLMPTVSIEQAIGLYCEALNNTSSAPSALEQQLAQQLWQGLVSQDVGLGSLFEVLNRIWSLEREEPKWQKKVITLPWSSFTHTAHVTPWLTALQQLGDQHFSFSDLSVTLPGNARANSRQQKQAAQLKSWIAGGWLEDVVYSWLSEHIPASQLSINLQTQTSDDRHSQREADILLLHKGITWVMEIKADLPPNQTLPDLENQLSSSAKRYGNTNKILFIGPELKNKLVGKNNFDSFKGRCKGNHVTLCYDKASLYKALGV
ncbi:hypothetical protein CBP31_13055 [Oceanisphaera profunda]|uniref:DUF1887 domain-containing protein n=2 Tax=Oceanisphaera profunda TaxID=1416627 RepID=A0A1Y0D8S9_9GAMM|nr:hypothetical protein CBP31_13055 [Oceanisphaera profunda]